MNNYCFVDAEKLPELIKKLTGSELRMLLLIFCYFSSHRKQYVVNNKDWRDYMASLNYDVTPERTSTIFSSLVKKGILKREVKGVFSVTDDLYMPMEKVKLEEDLLK